MLRPASMKNWTAVTRAKALGVNKSILKTLEVQIVPMTRPLLSRIIAPRPSLCTCLLHATSQLSFRKPEGGFCHLVWFWFGVTTWSVLLEIDAWMKPRWSALAWLIRWFGWGNLFWCMASFLLYHRSLEMYAASSNYIDVSTIDNLVHISMTDSLDMFYFWIFLHHCPHTSLADAHSQRIWPAVSVALKQIEQALFSTFSSVSGYWGLGVCPYKHSVLTFSLHFESLVSRLISISGSLCYEKDHSQISFGYPYEDGMHFSLWRYHFWCSATLAYLFYPGN